VHEAESRADHRSSERLVPRGGTATRTVKPGPQDSDEQQIQESVQDHPLHRVVLGGFADLTGLLIVADQHHGAPHVNPESRT
jgi:hypothetical protein